MKLLNARARLICPHPSGVVKTAASQSFVTIAGAPVLVQGDPVGKSIAGCLNNNPPLGIVQCSKTLAVAQGYSAWISIGGRRVCLDTVRGYTVSQPPATAEYRVANPGQTFVESDA